jgi:hypothetical protein
VFWEKGVEVGCYHAIMWEFDHEGGNGYTPNKLNMCNVRIKIYERAEI